MKYRNDSATALLNPIDHIECRIHYVELPPGNNARKITRHAHECCEIYVNVSGDVSFAVEDAIYPIGRGDVIITRPQEYHYCIHNTNAVHKHYRVIFWTQNNYDLLSIFFNRDLGKGNLIVLPEKKKTALISLCRSMVEGREKTQVTQMLDFLRLIDLLNGGVSVSSESALRFPDELDQAIAFIRENDRKPFLISDVAEECGVSIATLERLFKQNLQMSPKQYILEMRLGRAKAELAKGKNVSEAWSESGIADYSHFIRIFKKTIGVTPSQYRKTLNASVAEIRRLNEESEPERSFRRR